MVALGLCALSFAGLLWLPGRSWVRLPAVLAPMLALLAMRLGSWGQLPFAASLLLCSVLLALLLVVALLPVGRGQAGGLEAGTTSLDALSAREAEVLGLLLTGMTQAEAAECLGIKASTVGTYCCRALDKLGRVPLVRSPPCCRLRREAPKAPACPRLWRVASVLS